MKLRMVLALLLMGELSAASCKGNDSGSKASASKAADIQREAQSHPKAPPPENLPSNFKEGVPGTAERRCVDVNRLLEETGRDGAIRSGELVAGPFPTSSAAGPHTTRTSCNGDGTFQAPQLVLQNFGFSAGGWRVEQHPRFLADLTGDGRADIVGFGDGGVWVWWP